MGKHRVDSTLFRYFCSFKLPVLFLWMTCRLEDKLLQLLQTTLYLPKSPKQIQILCSAILREVSFCDDLSLPWDKFRDTRLLSLAFSIVQSQVSKAFYYYFLFTFFPQFILSEWLLGIKNNLMVHNQLCSH